MESLYSKKLKVNIKPLDKEERESHVDISVEWHQVGTTIAKELVIRLTDEDDLFFLGQLRLSEEDFLILKAQQGLLVDFLAFPRRFVDLLEQCLSEETREAPRYMLQIIASRDQGRDLWLLNVVEANPFKHLTHLSLKMSGGSDRDVKDFLATCLRQVKLERAELLQQLTETRELLSGRLERCQEQLSTRTFELEAARSELVARVEEVRVQLESQLDFEKEKTLETCTVWQQKLERERGELESVHARRIKTLEARVAELDCSNRALAEENLMLETALKESRCAATALEEETERLRRECGTARRELDTLERAHQEQGAVSHRLETRVAVLEQELADKELFRERTQELLATEQEARLRSQEESAARQRKADKLERLLRSKAEELTKGNDIIRKLQGDIRTYHVKVKLGSKVAAEQEKVLQAKETELSAGREALRETQAELSELSRQRDQLKEQLENTSRKLEESRQLLKTNENVIQWLNKQITENQLQAQASATRPAVRFDGLPTSRATGVRSYLQTLATGANGVAHAQDVAANSRLTQKARRHLPLSLAKSTPESVGVSDNKENQFATEDCDGATDGLELKYLQRSEGALVRGAAASQGLAPPLSPIRPPSAAPIGCNGEEDTSGTTSCNSNSVASAYFPTKSTGKSETEHNGSAEDVPSPAIVAAAATT